MQESSRSGWCWVPGRRALAIGLLMAGVAASAGADTLVLAKGKKIKDVTVARTTDGYVVNRFNSRHPEMTWEIPDSDRYLESEVAEWIKEDAPLVEYRRRAARRGATAAEHLELARYCRANKLKEEAVYELARALALEPENEELLDEFGGPSKWSAYARGRAEFTPELAQLEREYVAASDVDELQRLWRAMANLGTARDRTYLERARRGADLPRGRRDAVPLTLGSAESPGANYCIHVPASYDPLVPTPLVIGLHGGGPGGKDGTLVTGSGEQAMPFYSRESEEWGVIVVCPSALRAPWSESMNHAFMESLLEELLALYNIDLARVYLTGHSMGGFGTWFWAPRLADRLAACAPAAGGGGPAGVADLGLPTYIYHGSDDEIVGPDSDRRAALSLVDEKNCDFVYTEITNVGHGFPDWVRRDIFEFFAGRRLEPKRGRAIEPVSSFDAKPSKNEIAAFGDPRKTATADEGGAKLADLIEELEKGGGAGEAAVATLAEFKDDKSAAAVAKVLRDKDSNDDVKVLAARALGLMGREKSIDALVRALDEPDYRVLDAATRSIGQIGGADAASALAKAGNAIGARYDASFTGGNRIAHTEYVVRMASLAILCEATQAARIGSAGPKLLRVEVLERAFTQSAKPIDTDDPRFDHEPPGARRRLFDAVANAMVSFGAEEGATALATIEEHWPKEPHLWQRAEVAIAAIRAALEEGDAPR